jgi:hypothetical protein
VALTWAGCSGDADQRLWRAVVAATGG